jgi:hypothetical protein
MLLLLEQRAQSEASIYFYASSAMKKDMKL